jgi:archaellum component FlaF (FlaF/FlaG flagellin family)
MDNFKKFNRMFYRVFLVAVMVVSASVVHAQHGWTVTPADYEYTNDVNAVVVFEGADVLTGSLGAFVGTECRGFYDGPVYSPIADRYYFPLTVYSNAVSGEIMTFQYYDGVSFYDIAETVEFVPNDPVGDAANPVIFNVVTNTAPVVAAPLPDLVLNEYFVSDTIDLTGVFSDPDAGDVLTLSVTSSDETVVTVLIDGDSLIITEVGLGSSTITVTATDNGTPVLSVSDAFTVTVNDINGAPVVAAPLPDLVLNEYFVSDTIDLTGVFSDPDAGDVLTLSVTSSDETVVTVLIEGDSLIITEVGLGSSTVTVTATDNGTPVLSVSDTFTVTVNDINGAPVVAAPLPDLELNEYFVSDTIDLTGVFSDPDAGDVLTLSVTSSDQTVVTVLIDGDSLIITEVGLGSSTVTVTATDNGTPVLSVSDTFTVTVNDINGAPVVAAPLPDLELNEYFVSDTIDLTGVFSDPDAGDVLTLSVTSSDETVVTVLIEGDSLIITEVGLGSSTVTVTATDNGTPVLSVSDAFTVTVNDINGAPVVVAPLPDLVA